MRDENTNILEYIIESEIINSFFEHKILFNIILCFCFVLLCSKQLENLIRFNDNNDMLGLPYDTKCLKRCKTIANFHFVWAST